MSVATCLRTVSLLIVAYLSFGASGARACTATAPDVFLVGNTVTDHACNYGTIQDAVDAATCPAGTKIFLTDEINYTGQHISITNKNVSLIGKASGVHCGTLTLVCGPIFPCPTAPLETISGNIKIRGTSNVTIQYLTIDNGHGVADSNGTTYGGGIDYAATGELHIYTSTIEDNTADNGGGIRFQGYGGAAELFLHSHTLIDNNVTTNGGSGGGIRLEGAAILHADEPNIWIHDNDAADKGGGIAIVGPASAHIGSLGDFFFGSPVGVVSYNTAGNGGGIAVVAESTGAAGVDLFPTDPNHPVRIEHNRAHSKGGGVYAIPYNSFPSEGSDSAEVFMGGAQIDSNKAKEGSGIYLDTAGLQLGAALHFYTGHCAAGMECTTISNNSAVDIDHQDPDGNDLPTAGSAILFQSYSYVLGTARQFSMRGNTGAHAIRVADSLGAPLNLDTCLFADNHVTDYLITTGNASSTITQCTFAYNTIDNVPALLHVASSFSLTNSIVFQPSLRAVDAAGGTNVTLDYILAPQFDISLGTDPHIFYGNVAFVDPVNGDFHLGTTSLAIDKAAADDSNNRDMDNRPRDLDLPNVTNLDGPRDLGAYERQTPFNCGALDTIFCSGFDGP